jgi:hypothetical protein
LSIHLLVSLAAAAGAATLISWASGRRRRTERLRSVAAGHAEMARICRSIDTRLAEFGHLLTWPFLDGGNKLTGTCGGRQGLVTVTFGPVPGSFRAPVTDTEYGFPLADDDNFLACRGGSR